MLASGPTPTGSKLLEVESAEVINRCVRQGNELTSYMCTTDRVGMAIIGRQYLRRFGG